MSDKIGSTKYILWIGGVIPSLLIILLGLVTSKQFSSFEESDKWVDHTHEVLIRAHKIQESRSNLESGHRGFIITGDEQFLQAFNEEIKNIFRELGSLKEKISDNPVQVSRLGRIAAELHEWIEKTGEPGIEIRNSYNSGQLEYERISQSLIVDANKKQFNHFVELLEEFISTEESLSLKRQTLELVEFNKIRTILVVGVFIVVSISLLMGIVNTRIILGQDWVKSTHAKVLAEIQEADNLDSLSRRLLKHLISNIPVQIGSVYIQSDDSEREILIRRGSYGLGRLGSKLNTVSKEQGLVGECFSSGEMMQVSHVPGIYFDIESSLGSAKPHTIYLFPVLFENTVIAVIELASFTTLTRNEKKLLRTVTESLGVIVNSVQSRLRTEILLEKTKSQTDELTIQQEEIQKTSNRAQEAKLKAEQSAEMAKQANQAKSKFLANMSHELRTPLNSMLMLASYLALNNEGNLNQEQVKFANIIHDGGKDLLELINDILDLAKVEAGKNNLSVVSVPLSSISDQVKSTFSSLAESKNITFTIKIAESLPEYIETDDIKVKQILRNILSNAFKFTHEGEVRLDIRRPIATHVFKNPALQSISCIEFSISDTGIGIAKEDIGEVFEAFKQADDTTTRKYGGTGLGLTITREFVQLLGGEIDLMSIEDKGSTFSVIIPIEYTEAQKNDIVHPPTIQESRSADQGDNEHTVVVENIKDDRNNLGIQDDIILVIEDDSVFASILLREINNIGAKCIIAIDGVDGFSCVNKYKPAAIIMDIELPGMNGLELFDKLKNDSKTAHIPIYFISIYDEASKVLSQGAIGYLTKPITQEELREALEKIKTIAFSSSTEILIIEDDKSICMLLKEMLIMEGFNVHCAGTAEKGLEIMHSQKIQAIILDLILPDMSGVEMLEIISKDLILEQPPVIIYSSKNVSEKEKLNLAKYTNIFVRKNGGSPERILQEIMGGTKQCSEDDLDLKKEAPIIKRSDLYEGLKDKTVLLVDDDDRNIFSLSRMLEKLFGMTVIIAKNGQEALDILNDESSIDVVLMDIMMPVMNGYEATKKIRDQQRFENLPVIALTAKAMARDKDECFEVGVNDYIAKHWGNININVNDDTPGMKKLIAHLGKWVCWLQTGQTRKILND